MERAPIGALSISSSRLDRWPAFTPPQWPDFAPPLTVPEEGALYWIDVKAPALYRLLPDSGEQRKWPLTSDIGGFALMEGRAALVALRHGLHSLDLESGHLKLLAPPPFDPALFRFNEGACDASGRFWIGVMFDPIEGSPPEQAGKLHSFTIAGGLRDEPDAAELHNGMAWSADGKTFYLSHSNARQIFAFAFEPEHGRLSGRHIFADIPEADGIPDGAAIDEEGGYWCALHGGGKLRRFDSEGRVDRDVTMPVRQPTMCAFAGDQLSLLYVTSASDKMSDADLNREPDAGSLFRLSPGLRGIPRAIMVR